MPNRLRPSKNAVIYSLVDEEPFLGIPPTKPVTVPVLLYRRGSLDHPPTFDVEKVGECTYVIRANGYRLQDQDGRLVGSKDGEAQRWCIEYAERNDAYVVSKENDRGVGWVAPAEGDERQIRIRTLIVGPSEPPFYPSNQLFRFNYPRD
ncbi:hypothetical protein EDD16DRAFT_354370 [Pisolithus croceorrhizus]|nr:hypothetical protein F5141DRAFT_293723 [Pisolithus sp. B1]KAI6119207.1 hypothetical protein EV401DRAFT_1507753 [Pisolithus croceorrhizus]KAI6126098.1 hypothetical protein EDD16DRAFT_354370 [Pisolithus croceorrhizus]